MTSSARHLQPVSPGFCPPSSSSAPTSPACSSSPAPRRAVRSTDQIPELPTPNEGRPHINHKLKLKIIDFDAEIERLKSESLASTRRMVFDAELANMEGIKTLATLEEQDEQIDRIQIDLFQINDNMTEVKKDIRKMNKYMGCIPKRLFKCIPIQRCSRSGSLDAEVYTKNSHSTLVVSHKTKHSNKEKEGFVTRLTGDSAEDEMEANLRQVSEAVDNLRHLSIDIHTQLSIQDPKLNLLCAVADNSAIAVGGANREVKRLIGEK